MRENDDKLFLQQIQNGDEAAYEELVNTIGPSLYNSALMILQNEADAQDIVLDTYQELIEKSKLIKYPNALRSWLFTTVHNKSLNLLRVNKQSSHVSETKLEDIINMSSYHETPIDEKFIIAQGLSRLTKEEYDILILKLNKMSTRAVAEITHKTVAQVKLLYKKAKQKFLDYYCNDK